MESFLDRFKGKTSTIGDLIGHKEGKPTQPLYHKFKGIQKLPLENAKSREKNNEHEFGRNLLKPLNNDAKSIGLSRSSERPKLRNYQQLDYEQSAGKNGKLLSICKLILIYYYMWPLIIFICSK